MEAAKHTTKSPFCFKCFEASTAHISVEDNELLKRPTDRDIFAVYTYDYGYFIYTGAGEYTDDEFTAAKNAGYSDALINLIKLAAKNDCKFLNLDADGFVYDDLPPFDW
jgi:hypothetical protein